MTGLSPAGIFEEDKKVMIQQPRLGTLKHYKKRSPTQISVSGCSSG
jgi:hypothetical protein